MHPLHPTLHPFDKVTFVKYVKDVGREYRIRANNLVFICRFFVQAGEQTLSSCNELRSLLQVVDDALYSATEAGRKTTKDADTKFKKATYALSAYEKKYHRTETFTHVMVEAEAKDKSSSTVLKRMKETLRPLKEERTMEVEFLIHKSLPDKNPTIVRQVLSERSRIREILWNFSLFKDGRRLTLEDNPHFYKALPTSAEKYNGQFRTNSIETLQHERISVLTDNPRLTGWVFLETARHKQAFGNVWCPKEALIFKDICGKLEGENIVGTAIENTPNLWCFEEPLPSNASWSSLFDSTSPTTTATLITSPTGELLVDWREPIRRMLRLKDVNINIRISDKPPTNFSTGYSEPSSPSPSPDSSGIINSLSPTPPSREILIPGGYQGPQSSSPYEKARPTPLTQPPAVEISPKLPAPLSPESPILPPSLLPMPASSAAPSTDPAVPDPACPLPDTSSRGASRAGTATTFPQPDIVGLRAETNEAERNNSEVLNEGDSDAVSISNSENLRNVGDGSVDMKGSKYSLGS